MLAEEDVEMIISGRFGPNFKEILETKNIKYKEMTEITVKEALEKIK